MPKIKNQINRFFEKNIHHFQEGLFALAMVFILGGFLFSNFGAGGEQLKAFLGGNEPPAAELLKSSSSLQLLEDAAPTGAVKFLETTDISKWSNNDALIENLFTESLIFQIIEVAKYILGGVFMLFLGVYVLNFISAGNKEEASTKFKDQMLWAFVGFVILALAEPFSQAFMLLKEVDGSTSLAVSLLTDPASALASAEIVGFTYRSAAHLIQYILGGIALIVMGFSAFKMLSSVGDEESIKNARKSIVWAALGLIMAGAPLISKIFAPDAAIDSQIQAGAEASLQFSEILQSGQSQARILVLNYVKYFQTFVGAGAVLMIFLAGFKMISAAGNEEIVTKQRKMITWVFMGLAIILIAEGFVNVFMPEVDGEIAFESLTAIESFSAQMGGFTNFLLTFASAIAVLALIVGAVYISTAVTNPEQSEKGKKIILAAALGLIVTISAFALVNTVLSGDASGGAKGSWLDISVQK
ncbi:hypothetical protein KKF38_00365 [Patescibacteria group bacterium]|nr:hypothetical protein [Patescibacteria group bacterium]